MASHRRNKAVSADDDLYDYEDAQYEEQEESLGLTDQDREQLRQGSVQVRQALGSESPLVTEDEIQEALWHYYYDVGKSVSYLKNKQKPQPAKKDTAAQTPSTDFTLCSTPLSASAFFSDCPWFGIPAHRKADILIEPLYPSSGLLGGSAKEGKMSKLAALAAKRRQKENEKPYETEDAQVNRKKEGSTSLQSLRSSRRTQREPPTKQLRDGTTEQQLSIASSNTATNNTKLLKTGNTPSDPSAEGEADSIAASQPDTPVTAVRASPSPFAATITAMEPFTFDSDERLESQFASALRLNDTSTKLFDFTDPSPDDVVTRAQSKGPTSTKTAPKQTNNAKAKAGLNIGVKNLSIQEPIKIRSKNLDVLAEYKKVERKTAANFVVIGHVDAGKSTLMGRLLFDLKAVDQRTMDKYKKEAEKIGKGSFAFAWVLDQGTEERARGVTIDIATNKFETEKTSFTILDAPGHRDFVPNMIAGASQADFAVLVIDASTGNFESGLKGQTKEHALLVRSMGVQKMIVAVNKMDMAEWSRDRFQEIEQQMSAFLATAGFQPRNVSFIPCSGLQGDNILTRSSESKASWYTGPTLVEELETSEPAAHTMDKPFRMTIGDVFRGGVQNPLSVSGRVEAGNVQVGDQVLVMPSGEKAFIKNLEVDDEPCDWVVAGQNVVLHLTDIEQIHLKAGDILCSTASPLQNTTTFTAKVLAFEHLTPMNVDIHKGRLHVPGKISQLIAILDKTDGTTASKKRPKIVQPGSLVRVRVEMDHAVPLSEAGRIVLRANGETIAAGLIE